METLKKGVIGISYQFRERELYFLLLHRKKRLEQDWIGWEFPKGTVEEDTIEGKSLYQNMKDEAKEEANIVKSNIRPLMYNGKHYTYEYVFYRPSETIKKLMFVYLINVDRSEEIRVNGIEHDRFMWRNYGYTKLFLKKYNLKRALEIAKKVITGKYSY
jgi:8-oxo-dGTP pyrophosphatase MutT (NUDIX family)